MFVTSISTNGAWLICWSRHTLCGANGSCVLFYANFRTSEKKRHCHSNEALSFFWNVLAACVRTRLAQLLQLGMVYSGTISCSFESISSHNLDVGPAGLILVFSFLLGQQGHISRDATREDSYTAGQCWSPEQRGKTRQFWRSTAAGERRIWRRGCGNSANCAQVELT